MGKLIWQHWLKVVCLCLGLSFSPWVYAQEALLTHLSTTPSSDASDISELVMDFDQPVSYKVFTLTNPNRLVIDFTKTIYAINNPAQIDFSQTPISDFRHGIQHGTDLRLVFDLKQPIEFNSSTSTKGDGYRVILAIASTNTVSATTIQSSTSEPTTAINSTTQSSASITSSSIKPVTINTTNQTTSASTIPTQTSKNSGVTTSSTVTTNKLTNTPQTSPISTAAVSPSASNITNATNKTLANNETTSNANLTKMPDNSAASSLQNNVQVTPTLAPSAAKDTANTIIVNQNNQTPSPASTQPNLTNTSTVKTSLTTPEQTTPTIPSSNISSTLSNQPVNNPINNTASADTDNNQDNSVAIENNGINLLAGKKHKFIVVIDAGHGGKDPGTTGPDGTREKNVTLAIARDLRTLVNKQPNMRAVMTRDGDYYVGLRQRLALARQGKGDVFVAIHADAYKDPYAQGASVFALSLHGASSEAALWLAQKENYSELGGVDLNGIADQDAQVRSVLIDLSQTATIGASLQLGNDVIKQIGKMTPLHHGFVEQAPFMVLKSPDIPSILVETGFLSNPTEAAHLRNPAYQQQVAEALMTGIKQYYSQNAPQMAVMTSH